MMPEQPAFYAPLVALIAAEPDMARRIADEHTADRLGRCRACCTHSRTVRHPCVLSVAADQAATGERARPPH